MTDSEIVAAFMSSYQHGDTGIAWNWFVVKMDDDVRAEFDKRIRERQSDKPSQEVA